MKEIFLSASVPEHGRGDFYESADPFLIQFAVRELITVCLGRRRIVWGGHPSITPMVHAVCKDFGMEFAPPVLLYQSRFFEKRFPEDNKYFETILVDAVEGDLPSSLIELRKTMLSRPIETAVFIGGMEGIFQEYEIFQGLHGPNADVLALGAPGGAARQLAQSKLSNEQFDRDLDRIDFARLFQERLGISPEEHRQMKVIGDEGERPQRFNA
jgi:hypothetical protein